MLLKNSFLYNFFKIKVKKGNEMKRFFQMIVFFILGFIFIPDWVLASTTNFLGEQGRYLEEMSKFIWVLVTRFAIAVCVIWGGVQAMFSLRAETIFLWWGAAFMIFYVSTFL